MNIAEILKYCPRGTKLYSTVHGEVTLMEVDINAKYPIKVNLNTKVATYYTKDGLFFTGFGECVLFPSKEQRDWDRFRLPFKEGDIVMTIDGKTPFIFKEYVDNIYAHCYCGVDIYNTFKIEYPIDTCWTNEFIIPASKEAKKKLFDKMVEAGYIWYIDTLELEKVKPKFKEGDVVIDTEGNLFLSTGIIIKDVIQCYSLFADGTFISCGVSISSLKLASEEYRNKVYSNLIKRGYKYDKEQHKLIKQEFKPFDKVLVKNQTDEKWSINLFSYYDKENKIFPYVCLDGKYHYCTSYEGNEYILGTTINQI